MIDELPHDLDAEQATLGSVLMRSDALLEVSAWLKPEMFYLERHQAIYHAMLNLERQRQPIDLRTLSSELKRRDQLEPIGGIAYLSELEDAVPVSSRVAHYGKIVRRLALGRLALDVASKVARLSTRSDLEEDELRAEVQRAILPMMASDARGGFKSFSDVMSDVLTWLESDDAPGVMTDLYDYDRMTGGMRPGQLWILAGRPGHGKSALATTILRNVTRRGERAAMFTLEMEALEIGTRLLSMEAGIDGALIQDRRLEDAEYIRVATAMGSISNWPGHLEDVTVSLADIRARVLRLTAEYGPLACVIVDYLQLVRPDTRYTGNRQLEVAGIARGLKELAKEAQTAVVALSQMNRESETKDGKFRPPVLSDLRESGEIEQAANHVAFVVRPSLYSLEQIDIGMGERKQTLETDNLGVLYIAKQRGRPTGVVPLAFNAPLTRFDALERGRVPEGY